MNCWKIYFLITFLMVFAIKTFSFSNVIQIPHQEASSTNKKQQQHVEEEYSTTLMPDITKLIEQHHEIKTTNEEELISQETFNTEAKPANKQSDYQIINVHHANSHSLGIKDVNDKEIEFENEISSEISDTMLNMIPTESSNDNVVEISTLETTTTPFIPSIQPEKQQTLDSTLQNVIEEKGATTSKFHTDESHLYNNDNQEEKISTNRKDVKNDVKLSNNVKFDENNTRNNDSKYFDQEQNISKFSVQRNQVDATSTSINTSSIDEKSWTTTSKPYVKFVDQSNELKLSHFSNQLIYDEKNNHFDKNQSNKVIKSTIKTHMNNASSQSAENHLEYHINHHHSDHEKKNGYSDVSEMQDKSTSSNENKASLLTSEARMLANKIIVALMNRDEHRWSDQTAATDDDPSPNNLLPLTNEATNLHTNEETLFSNDVDIGSIFTDNNENNFDQLKKIIPTANPSTDRQSESTTNFPEITTTQLFDDIKSSTESNNDVSEPSLWKKIALGIRCSMQDCRDTLIVSDPLTVSKRRKLDNEWTIMRKMKRFIDEPTDFISNKRKRAQIVTKVVEKKLASCGCRITQRQRKVIERFVTSDECKKIIFDIFHEMGIQTDH